MRFLDFLFYKLYNWVLIYFRFWYNIRGLFFGDDKIEGFWIGDFRYKWSQGFRLKIRGLSKKLFNK